MAQFNSSGGSQVTGSLTVGGVSTPVIDTVDIPNSNTEYSYTLPSGTTRFIIKLRESGTILKLAYTSGDSGTTYFTVPRGSHYGEEGVITGQTLYFQCPVGSQTLEILSWS